MTRLMIHRWQLSFVALVWIAIVQQREQQHAEAFVGTTPRSLQRHSPHPQLNHKSPPLSLIRPPTSSASLSLSNKKHHDLIHPKNKSSAVLFQWCKRLIAAGLAVRFSWAVGAASAPRSFRRFTMTLQQKVWYQRLDYLWFLFQAAAFNHLDQFVAYCKTWKVSLWTSQLQYLVACCKYEFLALSTRNQWIMAVLPTVALITMTLASMRVKLNTDTAPSLSLQKTPTTKTTTTTGFLKRETETEESSPSSLSTDMNNTDKDSRSVSFTFKPVPPLSSVPSKREASFKNSKSSTTNSNSNKSSTVLTKLEANKDKKEEQISYFPATMGALQNSTSASLALSTKRIRKKPSSSIKAAPPQESKPPPSTTSSSSLSKKSSSTPPTNKNKHKNKPPEPVIIPKTSFKHEIPSSTNKKPPSTNAKTRDLATQDDPYRLPQDKHSWQLPFLAQVSKSQEKDPWKSVHSWKSHLNAARALVQENDLSRVSSSTIRTFTHDEETAKLWTTYEEYPHKRGDAVAALFLELQDNWSNCLDRTTWSKQTCQIFSRGICQLGPFYVKLAHVASSHGFLPDAWVTELERQRNKRGEKMLDIGMQMWDAVLKQASESGDLTALKNTYADDMNLVRRLAKVVQGIDTSRGRKNWNKLANTAEEKMFTTSTSTSWWSKLKPSTNSNNGGGNIEGLLSEIQQQIDVEQDKKKNTKKNRFLSQQPFEDDEFNANSSENQPWS